MNASGMHAASVHGNCGGLRRIWVSGTAIYSAYAPYNSDQGKKISANVGSLRRNFQLTPAARPRTSSPACHTSDVLGPRAVICPENSTPRISDEPGGTG